MALPIRAVPTGYASIAGEQVEVKGLTMGEVRRVKEHKNSDALAIAISCGYKLEEAVAWWDSAPAGDVAVLLAKIFELSGLDTNEQDAQFPVEE